MRTRGLTLPRNCYFACSPGFTGSVALSMPLGLIAGRLFNPFRRAISARCSPTIFFRAATLPRSSISSASSSGRLRSEKDNGGGTSTQIVPHQARASEKCSTARGFAPVTKHGAKSRRKWRKLHLAVDAENGMIAAQTLTDQDDDDPSQVAPLLDQ